MAAVHTTTSSICNLILIVRVVSAWVLSLGNPCECYLLIQHIEKIC